jgi:hypothetical protein
VASKINLHFLSAVGPAHRGRGWPIPQRQRHVLTTPTLQTVLRPTMARVFEVYVQSLPVRVAEKARSEFPGAADCYRIKDDQGHYMLVGFEEPELDIDQGVAAIMVHGKDSTMP